MIQIHRKGNENVYSLLKSIFIIPVIAILLAVTPTILFAQGDNSDWTLTIYAANVPPGQTGITVSVNGPGITQPLEQTIPSTPQYPSEYPYITFTMNGLPAGEYEVCIKSTTTEADQPGLFFYPDCTSFTHEEVTSAEIHTI